MKKIVPVLIGVAITGGLVFVIAWAAGKGWKSAS